MLFVLKEVFFLWRSRSGGRDIPTSLSWSNGSTCPSYLPVSGMSRMLSLPTWPPSLHCFQAAHGRMDADDPECSYRQTIIHYKADKTILDYLMDWDKAASAGWVCEIAQWAKTLSVPACPSECDSETPLEKKRTSFQKLSSDLHVCHVYRGTCVSTLTCAYKIINKRKFKYF